MVPESLVSTAFKLNEDESVYHRSAYIHAICGWLWSCNFWRLWCSTSNNHTQHICSTSSKSVGEYLGKYVCRQVSEQFMCMITSDNEKIDSFIHFFKNTIETRNIGIITQWRLITAWRIIHLFSHFCIFFSVPYISKWKLRPRTHMETFWRDVNKCVCSLFACESNMHINQSPHTRQYIYALPYHNKIENSTLILHSYP